VALAGACGEHFSGTKLDFTQIAGLKAASPAAIGELSKAYKPQVSGD
jgi:hypothetical protein